MPSLNWLSAEPSAGCLSVCPESTGQMLHQQAGRVHRGAAYKTKRRASNGDPPPSLDFDAVLEVDRHAGEDVPAQRVVDLRIGVAVRAQRRDRRLLVEDVVGA